MGNYRFDDDTAIQIVLAMGEFRTLLVTLRLSPAARAGARVSCDDFGAGVWDFDPKPE
jgi:hypothetical protein